MHLRLLFSKWTPIASLLMMSGALAWMIKLCVIISTDGRIIDTGAAALFMRAGLILLIVGSTAIGHRLSVNRKFLLRIIAIILSPIVVFGSFLLFGMITNPLFKNSSVLYAQQEAPIAVAVIVYLSVGFSLYRSYNSVARQNKID